MTEHNKKVINPLFNNAVTGGTIEDFSQNALLLPAKEKPPVQPPVVPVLQDQALTAGDFFETIPASSEPFPNQAFDINHQQYPTQHEFGYQNINPPIDYNSQQPQPQSSSNLSSVFSSFSNILKLKGNSPQPIDDSVPPPAGIEALISQDPANVEPIPLFPSSVVQNNLPAPSPAPPPGSVNTFRRAGTKRPVYAQVPGLSSSSQPPPPVQGYNQPPPIPQQSSATPADFFTPASASSSILTEFVAPKTVSPALSGQDAYAPQGHFKPISPQPTTLLHPVSTPQTFLSGACPPSHLQSPVMAAIPANEVLQSAELNPANALAPGMASTPLAPIQTSPVYRPVYHHWFHKREIEGKVIWQPFSMVDSLALDQAFTSHDIDPDKVVATDGGRFDVNILRRQRSPVYWKGDASEVRRCSWFHKGNSDGRIVPYEENIATKLEEEYKSAFDSNQWHRKVELSNGETVVFHAPDVLVLFPPTQSPDAWGNTPNQSRPRVVKRGMDEFDIDEGEPAKVDHLLFLVHGIGSVCDLKFRTVEEVVDEFRSISLQLVQSHYKSSCEKGIANRVEVLPISWHDELHSDDTGIDGKLKSITLDSIPRLRDFTNDTLLDILFYTSPIYCQTIISTVGNQLNKTFEVFKQRNPDFQGGVSLGGHSLGSLILFDLLCHQHPEPEPQEPVEGDEDIVAPLKPPPMKRKISRRISYMMTTAGTGQPQIHYPHLSFQPKAFFALGSPIGMFVTIRGLDTLGEHFALPTCPAFFNIFHPYDPVAYRVESLVNPDLSTLKPVLIPHHKGRKRMHLELKETMARVGADLKQKVVDSMKSTWNSFYQLAMFHRSDQASLEEEVNKAFKEQLRETEEDLEVDEPEQQLTDLPLGQLNNKRRIDYVLQEAPFEFFNEYLFALTSHVCYWESEDTMLLILKEIYSSMGISTDDKIPQQTMTIERPPSSPKSTKLRSLTPQGMDPTVPQTSQNNLGPPPTAGFVRKT